MKIVLTVGLPGSGKSTYLERLKVNAISSDEIRRLIIDDPHNQTVHARVFAAMRYLIRQRISVGRKVTYVDATHLRRWERRPYIQLARRHGCKLEVWFFDTPLEVCIQRNDGRERPVPDGVIRKLAEKLEPPVRAEGFDRVVVIRPE